MGCDRWMYMKTHTPNTVLDQMCHSWSFIQGCCSHPWKLCISFTSIFVKQSAHCKWVGTQNTSVRCTCCWQLRIVTIVRFSSVRGFSDTKTSYKDLQSVTVISLLVICCLYEGTSVINSVSIEARKEPLSKAVSHADVSAASVERQTRAERLDFQSKSVVEVSTSVPFGSASMISVPCWLV